LGGQQSRYRVLGSIGQGQYGQVYCAVNRYSGEWFALKYLDRRRLTTHRFLRELRFLLSLNHPNIVTCHALEHNQTGRFIVMDYCEGGTLRELIELAQPLSLTQKLNLIADILAGLAHAHRQNVIHCDLKPENILLNVKADGWVARVSDFGVARLAQEMGQMKLGDTGAPAYAAPERFYGEYSRASDIYAVGVMLYELLMGDRPFSGMPGELITAHLNRAVQIPESVPFLLRTILTTALKKLPGRRFATAEDMLKSIRLAANVIPATQLTALAIPLPPVSIRRQDVQVERLQEPLTHLAATSRRLYRGTSSCLRVQFYPNGILENMLAGDWQLPLPGVLSDLTSLPQGSAIAIRSPTVDSLCTYAIYCVPNSHFRAEANLLQNGQCHLEESWLVSSGETDAAVMDVNRQGKWLALATLTPNSMEEESALLEGESVVATEADREVPESERLSLATLGMETPPGNRWSRFQVLRLSQRLAVRSPTVGAFPNQLIALDSRYGLAVFSWDRGDDACETRLQLFTRRGNWLKSLHLPLGLQQLVQNVVMPYRLLALERHNPTCVLSIDLKPLSVTRFFVGIKPEFVAAAPWGYALASRVGEIALLNRSGRKIGEFALPAEVEAVTAIAPVGACGLAIATWSGEWGELYRFDLRHLHLDLGDSC
jgi:serine/threonine-protein kinase